jgi:hypothetical protein
MTSGCSRSYSAAQPLEFCPATAMTLVHTCSIPGAPLQHQSMWPPEWLPASGNTAEHIAVRTPPGRPSQHASACAQTYACSRNPIWTNNRSHKPEDTHWLLKQWHPDWANHAHSPSDTKSPPSTLCNQSCISQYTLLIHTHPKHSIRSEPCRASKGSRDNAVLHAPQRSEPA